MEPRPVQHHQRPAYPTRREVLAGAATLALANLAGCKFVLAEADGGKIIVAPIFEHGPGRGVTGCVMITPPVFLSEEEGMQILREELAKHEIQLKTGGILEGIRLSARTKSYKELWKDGKREVEEPIVEIPDESKPLKPSGIDAGKGIAVEFVSEKNYFDLGGLRSGGATITLYDFKDAAEYVAAQARKQGKGRVFFGVFYDPNATIPEFEWPKQDGPTDTVKEAELRRKLMEYREKSTVRGKAESKKLLRQQAQDFVAWLKGRKAIQ